MSHELVDRAMDLHGELLAWTRTHHGRRFCSAMTLPSARAIAEQAPVDGALAGVGWALDDTDEIFDSVDDLGPVFEGSLSHAHTFAVTADIGELLAYAATTVPDYPLYESDLPTTGGVVVFEEPIVVPDVHGKSLAVKALTWFHAAAYRGVGHHGFGVELPNPTRRGIISTLWTVPSDPRDHLHDEWLELRETWRSKVGHVPQYLPMFGSTWDYDDVPHLELNRLLLAFFRFVREPFVDHRAIAPGRPTRRRANRAGLPSTDGVHVVQLRRRATTPTTPSDESVEWSHRWLVRGHWRMQPYPSEGRVAPKWIASYIKGPDDKPLVVRDKVFEVRR